MHGWARCWWFVISSGWKQKWENWTATNRFSEIHRCKWYYITPKLKLNYYIYIYVYVCLCVCVYEKWWFRDCFLEIKLFTVYLFSRFVWQNRHLLRLCVFTADRSVSPVIIQIRIHQDTRWVPHTRKHTHDLMVCWPSVTWYCFTFSLRLWIQITLAVYASCHLISWKMYF